MSKVGYVYFVQVGLTTTCKIGSTINPEQRLKKLQSQRKGLALRYVALIPYPNHEQAEQRYQMAYREYHLSGEWFCLPGDVFEKMCRVGLSGHDSLGRLRGKSS